MSKTQDDQMPTTFPDKWLKVLKDMPEFKDTADGSSVEELKAIIITSEGNISLIEKEKSEDAKLNGAKDLVKEYSASYRDGIKCQTAKVKYALFLLEGKGIEIGDKESE
jgi:hypothetical protein